MCDLPVRTDVLAIISHICVAEGRKVDILVSCGGIARRAPAVTFPDDKRDAAVRFNEWMERGICVNALAPGYVETGLTKGYSEERERMILDRVPAGRWGRPHDLAAAAVDLAGRGRYVFAALIRA
ncbi:hypothetical protein HO133_006796 [Letharia lupina]|uniref:SDR family oxidoreductase n=1 Tax=Letharia lupina TaxID=560253 RepID=A0A8H6F7D4_9LECA|nr:uncharacterized protein HO133_006796 [Letharia lupina]KAF6217458.1 hypothetical protein HO133_006796 [Letharia lupina]